MSLEIRQGSERPVHPLARAQNESDVINSPSPIRNRGFALPRLAVDSGNITAQGNGRIVGLLLHCTCCRSSALDMPVHPRGDDAVECRACGQWFTYGELERAAAAEARSLLKLSFPYLAAV